MKQVALAGVLTAVSTLMFQSSRLVAQNRPQPISRETAQQIWDTALALYDPVLIRTAEARGLYNREDLPILREMNPYFINGDFNGDGAQDVAFWVKQKGTGLRGVAILHSTLDTLYVFGAGRSQPPVQKPGNDPMSVDAWHLLQAGAVVGHPFDNVPEIGVREGVPFTFQRQTLEFVYLEKSAFVFYWANGRYWHFWTAD